MKYISFTIFFVDKGKISLYIVHNALYTIGTYINPNPLFR